MSIQVASALGWVLTESGTAYDRGAMWPSGKDRIDQLDKIPLETLPLVLATGPSALAEVFPYDNVKATWEPIVVPYLSKRLELGI